MRLNRLLKILDDSDKVIRKLEIVTIKAYGLAQLAYTLYKIAAHR